MTKKKKKPLIVTERDVMKMEIARELGIWEQIENQGWESLSNAACGRIGGIMKKRLRQQREAAQGEAVQGEGEKLDS
jgi:hypothetical protein